MKNYFKLNVLFEYDRKNIFFFLIKLFALRFFPYIIKSIKKIDIIKDIFIHSIYFI